MDQQFDPYSHLKHLPYFPDPDTLSQNVDEAYSMNREEILEDLEHLTVLFYFRRFDNYDIDGMDFLIELYSFFADNISRFDRELCLSDDELINLTDIFVMKVKEVARSHHVTCELQKRSATNSHILNPKERDPGQTSFDVIRETQDLLYKLLDKINRKNTLLTATIDYRINELSSLIGQSDEECNDEDEKLK